MSDVFHIRASSLPDLFDCPARWYAANILGIRKPSSGAAYIGTALHRSTALFDSRTMAGSPISADDAAGELVDAIRHPDQDVHWHDWKPSQAERIGLMLHTRYCIEIAPQRVYSGVEVLCEELAIDCGDGLTIVLTGTTDRIREVSQRRGIADIKSGKNAVGTDGVPKTKGHGLQMAVYELLAEAATGQPMEEPAEIIGLQTTQQARIGTATISSARLQLLGDGDRPGALHHAAHMLKSGMFPGNPRSYLCSEKFCVVHPDCLYRER